MTDLTDLIARVENGEGADRGLDADIELALGNWTPEHHEAWHRYQECGEAVDPPMMCVPVDPQWLTTSLDAVMALVPEGWGHRFTRYPELTQKHHADVWTHEDAEPGDDWFRGRHKTSPARALLAAILRAKEAGQ